MDDNEECCAKRQRLEKSLQLNSLEEWFRAKQVWWEESALELSRNPEKVVHGLGVVSKRKIRKGEVLFRIPRNACFGARSEAEEKENIENKEEFEFDTQTRHALALIREASLGEKSVWHPLISSLPSIDGFNDLVWLKSNGGQCVQGTELEVVVKQKLIRLQEELKAIQLEGGHEELNIENYSRACGVVLSHLNPWFGTCIAPFVYILNCPNNNKANVDFELAEENESLIVGRSIRSIKKGEELTQAYGNDVSAAELIYRCGFSLPTSIRLHDVVSFSFTDIFDLFRSSELLQDDTTCQIQRLFLSSSLFQASPWDGLEDYFTIELTIDENCESSVSQVALACYVVSLGKLGELKNLTKSFDACMKTFEKYDDRLDDTDKSALSLTKSVLDVVAKVVVDAEHDYDDYGSLLKTADKLLSLRDPKSKSSNCSGRKEEEDEDDEVLWEFLLDNISFVNILSQRENVSKLLENRKSNLQRGVGVDPWCDNLRHRELGVISVLESLLEKL